MMPSSTLRRFPDPRNAPWYEMPAGVDMMNTLLKIRPGFAQKMDNMEYSPDTPKRRRAFVPLRLFSGADLATDYTSLGAFGMAHEYIDSAGASRILRGHANGTIQELDRTSGADTARVTGLTASKLIRFETFMGACIAVNGVDAPQRADDDVWRTFGAPAGVAGLNSASLAAGALTGAYQWIVVPCIQVGGLTVVRGDWSNILQTTLAAQRNNLAWAASPDLRVNAYEIYRSFSGLGYPYYLEGTVTGRLTVTYQSNTTDAALSGQVADEAGRNGAAPIAKYVASAGKRVIFGFIVDATDPDASKTVWISLLATNRYECEYFPNDKTYRLRLPGKGDVTCIRGVGTSAGQESGSDLFIAQEGSCYLIPQADPLQPIQVISNEVGVLNNEACAQWGKYLFFVSRRGLEFLGPTGAPILLSKNVQAVFRGGGELGYNGNQGDQYLTLTVADNILLITTRQDSGKTWGDTVLALDLSTFSPNITMNSDPQSSSRFTIWTGCGFSFFLWTRDRTLFLFDNQYARILQGGAGAYDSIAGVQTEIDANIWSGQILGESPEKRKTLCYVNLYVISDNPVTPRFDGDYGAVSTAGSVETVAPTHTPRAWDKQWDKTWYGSTSFSASKAIPRGISAQVFQFKLQIKNDSAVTIFVGLVLHYRSVMSRVTGKR
jgi:hypothetical protein